MRTRTISIAALVLTGVAAFLYLRVPSVEAPAGSVDAVGRTAAGVLGDDPGRAGAGMTHLVVYKTATCGCCGAWIEHMKKSGFEVEVHDLTDLVPVKEELGVAPPLRSCHTAVVGGYVVEGHVPAAQIVRMLAERPAIRGLAVPGMPIGSPGMDEGYDRSLWQDFDVIAFDPAGGQTVYAHVDTSP